MDHVPWLQSQATALWAPSPHVEGEQGEHSVGLDALCPGTLSLESRSYRG